MDMRLRMHACLAIWLLSRDFQGDFHQNYLIKSILGRIINFKKEVLIYLSVRMQR